MKLCLLHLIGEGSVEASTTRGRFGGLAFAHVFKIMILKTCKLNYRGQGYQGASSPSSLGGQSYAGHVDDRFGGQHGLDSRAETVGSSFDRSAAEGAGGSSGSSVSTTFERTGVSTGGIGGSADRFGSSTGAIGSSFDRSASVGADGASVAAGSFTGASGSADSSRFSGAEIGTTGGSSSSSSFSGSSFSADAPVATGSSGSQIEVTGTSETDSGAAGASSTSFERTEFTKISSPSSSAVSSSAGLPPRMDGIAPDAASGAGLDVE
uniref:Fibroin heavy chain-like n=2 Tax=Bursaphelenchus xylophilus TaxID=6326 RepID=A0A1I7SIB1_BURXY